MLEFLETSISIKGLKIVKDLYFTVKSGEITVLLGKNGSGKSTLLSALGGSRRYTGSIMLSGKELSSLSAPMRARQIALLPQLLPETGMSVGQLCELGRNPYVGTLGRLSPKDHEAVAQALEIAGVSAFCDRRVSTLSGGERQRAFVAMLLSQETPLLVMDEPTTFMDVAARGEFFSLCRQLKAAGKTLLLVLHDPSEAVRLADGIVILEEGRAVFAGDRQTCLETGAIERHFSLRRCQDGEDIFFI